MFALTISLSALGLTALAASSMAIESENYRPASRDTCSLRVYLENYTGAVIVILLLFSFAVLYRSIVSGRT